MLCGLERLPLSRTASAPYPKSNSAPYSKRKGDSSYEKGGLGERRGSVPVVSSASVSLDDSMDGPSTPSRIASFFSRKGIKSNLKRTKSVTKLDRKRPGTNNDLEGGTPKIVSSLKRTMSLGRLTRKWTPRPPNPDDTLTPASASDLKHVHDQYGALINARMRTSRSHESLLVTHSAMHSIDLSAADVEIKPLHSSILGQEHCFQVSTSHGSKYYSCRTAQERQRWIQCLRKSVHPNQEKTKRMDNSLKIWIQEAKNVPPKKRYFAEICLDKALYARTSTKLKNELLFWGEQFDFNSLPAVETITVNLYKEADKKKKKEKNILIGYVLIPVSEINTRQLVEKWFTASSAVVGKGKENKNELPLIRIKARYQTVTILPMEMYSDFIQYLKTDYVMLCEILEPIISVRAKEEIATTMVNILQRLGCVKEFLSDIVMAEVDKLDNENLTFRGNSIATKAMEAYMKLVGEKYLQDTLGDLIKTVLDSSEDCEVDPTRVPNSTTLQRHQTNLVMYCEMAWFKIINSYCFFPSELREVFASLKERCEERKRPPDLITQLISACIFLRFLCPAVLSPSLFGLLQEFPQERPARNLTLIAKTIQNVANFTKFGGKEEYMTYMNDFVEREFDSMHTFLAHISSPEGKSAALEFDGYIDLGKELSLLHTLLIESIEKMTEASEEKLQSLTHILSDISEALTLPSGTLRRTRTPANPHIYDNVTRVPHSPETAKANGHRPVGIKHYEPDVSHSSDFSVPNHVDVASDTSARRRSFNRSNSGLDSNDDYVLLANLDTRLGSDKLSASQRSGIRPNEQQVNQSWSKMVSAADMVNGDYVDLISFMDELQGQNNSTAELDNGSQVSIGQLSTVASSGYQSFGYSQSSSPVDSAVHQDQFTPVAQPLSFANPLFQHQNNSQTQTARLPLGPMRIMSSSSLSSDDGASSPSQRSSHPHQRPSEGHKLSSVSCSSSSCESLNQYRTAENGSIGRRCPSSSSQASSRSGRSQLLTHSQSVSGNSSFQSPPSPDISTSRAVTIAELSRSAEFLKQRQPVSPSRIKRNATDSALAAACEPMSEPPVRRCSVPTNTVRMGVRSVQRRHDQELSKPEYEQELNILRQQLAETQAMLHETQQRLLSQETTWKTTLEDNEDRLKKEQSVKDDQMKGIIHRLISVEERLRREQVELKNIVDQKQTVIESQERRIQSLDAANARLLSALNQLKDRCNPPSRNGTVSPINPKLSIASENGQFKSSSC